LNAILTDGRPFKDFNKPGNKKLLSLVVPGYKPKSPRSITKNTVNLERLLKK